MKVVPVHAKVTVRAHVVEFVRILAPAAVGLDVLRLVQVDAAVLALANVQEPVLVVQAPVLALALAVLDAPVLVAAPVTLLVKAWLLPDKELK